jgi:NAD(P)-dependent dehydrogenase (short-subunit alcohol dehydrogenase family)
MTLNQKHALITGGSRGIGRGIALKFAESGINVAVHYYRNESAAKETLEEVRKRGADGFVVQADICRPAEIMSMFQRVKAHFCEQRTARGDRILLSTDGRHLAAMGHGL